MFGSWLVWIVEIVPACRLRVKSNRAPTHDSIIIWLKQLSFTIYAQRPRLVRKVNLGEPNEIIRRKERKNNNPLYLVIKSSHLISRRISPRRGILQRPIETVQRPYIANDIDRRQFQTADWSERFGMSTLRVGGVAKAVGIWHQRRLAVRLIYS
jgi:hypothetical protein